MTSPPDIHDLAVAPERPDSPEAAAMVAALDAYLTGLYPPESRHLLDIETLCRPEVTFLVARVAGAAAGCGALVRDARGWGELKRMFVKPEARGRGVARRLIAELEAIAARDGFRLVRLETGIHNAEALAAYRRAGYRECGPFGDYFPDPLSVHMEKRLG